MMYPGRPHPRPLREHLPPAGGLQRWRRFLPLRDGESGKWDTAAGPLGGSLMLRALRDCRGAEPAGWPNAELLDEAARANRLEGIDFCPEAGATLAAIP